MPHVARSPKMIPAAEHLLTNADMDGSFGIPSDGLLPTRSSAQGSYDSPSAILSAEHNVEPAGTRDSEAIEEEARPAYLEEAAPWGLVLNTVLYMASPMSMPATFAAAGWVWGNIFLVYSSIITYNTGLLLGDICSRMPHLGSFPAIAAKCGGKSMMWLVIFMQFLTFWIDSSAQMLYCAQYLGLLFPSLNVCQSHWLIVVATATLPLMQVPTYHESRWFALPTFCVLVLVLGVFFYEADLVAPWRCSEEQLDAHHPSYPEPPLRSILLSGSAFAYAFGGHGMFPEEIRELRDKSDWNRVVMPWSYAIIVPMYISTSVMGFYVWGGGENGANANINSNFPLNSANTASMIVQLVLTYYLIFFTSLCLALNLEIALGIDPSACCVVKSESAHGAHDDVAALPTSPCRMIPPFASRGVLRSLLLASQLGLCQMLLGGEGDTLLALQSLSGAIGMAAFTYFLPFFFFWKLFPGDVGRGRAVWYGMNGTIGIAIMISGVVAALFDLVDSSFTLGGSVCDINGDDGKYYRGCNINLVNASFR
ncbi:MAG: hypothetical protein SGPRY_005808 [Prymnesium sp.]